MFVYKLFSRFKIVGAIKDVRPKANIFEKPKLKPGLYGIGLGFCLGLWKLSIFPPTKIPICIIIKFKKTVN